MRILKISGRNLASLADEFCVDFEQQPLASAGLFAISGPTGAGKSTLLDALCLALYDATPRLLKSARGGTLVPDVGSDTVSAQDPRTLLRRGAGEAHAEVDFVGNDQLRYRARWSVRRSRGKAGGALQKSAMALHRLPDLIALGGTKTEVADEIVRRIGLTFEQFTRAVLLAQNEFSAFLKTEENERGELLETLTGSTIYSAISRRAFERYKAEQTILQGMSARLADHGPLARDTRAELDAASAAADAALGACDTAKAALEARMRWREQADALAAGEHAAAQALEAAQAALDSTAARRRYLATLDAVQAARPMVAEAARLQQELASLDAAGAAAALAEALADQARCGAAAAAASAQLAQAEQDQRDSAPLLDQAKALDAAIDALAPGHASAAAARAQAGTELAAASAALQTLAAQLEHQRANHGAILAWLASHAEWELLAIQWPRWESLLLQARSAAATEADGAQQLEAASLALHGAAAADSEAASRLAASAARTAQLEAARQQALAVVARIDHEQLRHARQALDQQRAQLARADQLRSERAALQARQAHNLALAAQLNSGASQAATLLAQAAAKAPLLGAALAQAERSLKAAELACAGNVIDLRARLADGEACPVCGSADHPYQHQDAGLQAMLAGLQGEVERGRAQAGENLRVQAAQRALQDSCDAQLAACMAEGSALEAALAASLAAWDALDSEAKADGLAQALAAQSAQLEQAESAARAAGAARDLAQLRCDQASGEHAASVALAGQAASALAQARAHQLALGEKCTSSAVLLNRLLAELDAPLRPWPQWQTAWRADMQGFDRARALEAGEWQAHSASQAELGGTLAALAGEQAAAQLRHAKAVQDDDGAAARLRQVDSEIAALRTQRALLFGGRAARAVEQDAQQAVAAARSALAARQAATLAAAQAESRARAAQAHLAERQASLTEQSALAREQLAQWLAHYHASHPELLPIAELDCLLARDSAWIAAERSALQAAGASVASAATVLAERQARRQLHLQALAARSEDSIDSLSAQLQEAGQQRQRAHEAATALRLQLAQDDERRERASAMLAGIEQQQLTERRWGRMNELIGSADGKKFRNYAQQFTLDVLLGYANSHLGQLARRYRLERVTGGAGPSLGLMVRDQDMGGEVRSVNSLSGGEAFLVSLALALGLASLSSNRVKVESLFIDEGFGSLDSDTLRVAMDALDGLQSLGRKVGVISHVQEMTERIATRIVVRPGGAGTSSVTVQ